MVDVASLALNDDARHEAGVVCHDREESYWCWECWKQATSYCETDLLLFEFCGCVPA